MFSTKSFATLALALSVVLAVPAWRRDDIPDRSEWQSKNLETYYRFKSRYRNNGCADIQGTDFYNQCCVPLPSGSTPPPQCTPAWCLAPQSSTTLPTSVVSSPCSSAPATTPTPDNDDANDGDDDDLPYCDEVDSDYNPVTSSSYTEPTSSPAPAPAPEPTTTTPAPEPTTTTPAPEPTTTTPTQPDPAPATTDNNSGNSDVFTDGFATFYFQGGNAGACGQVNSDDAFIGAVDVQRYGDLGSRSSECGRRVRITNQNNGKTVDITFADVCPTCVNGNSIDLSVAAFKAIADLSDGLVPISWHYI